MRWRESYPSAEIQSVYSTAPPQLGNNLKEQMNIFV